MKIKTKIERYPEDVIEITSKIKPFNLIKLIEINDIVDHFKATDILDHLEFQTIQDYAKAAVLEEIQGVFDVEDVINAVGGEMEFEDLIDEYKRYKKKKIKV